MPSSQYSGPERPEVDLVQLFRQLWGAKWLVASITGVGLAVAVLYLLLVVPTYEVSVLLRPIQTKALEAVNARDIYALTPREALDRVASELSAYSGRFEYFQAHPERFQQLNKDNGLSAEQAFWKFNLSAFSMKQADLQKDPQATPFVQIFMQYPKGMDGAGILNDMVSRTIDSERRQILEDLQARVDSRLQFLAQDIEGKRASYQASKQGRIARLLEADNIRRAGLEDELKALRGRLKMVRDSRIQQLNEAIQISTRLGIVKPTTPGALGEVGLDGSRSVFRTEVNNQQIPLYFMGVDALTAERDTLLKRKGDDFTEPRVAAIQQELKQLENNREVQYLQARQGEERFFDDIEKLRGEQARLQTLKVGDLKIELVRVDQRAAMPLQPIKPRKVVVLVLGGLGGLMLGVLLALARAMLRSAFQQRQDHALPPGVVSLERTLSGT
ncbi:chain-length determining protein [Pseudomonas aeruginosa]|uniref:Chain length determinant protein n=1 Tax=Pseudomonas paraeruginosa (strain DSM 24068 / PA7) TaxID=381754 RepID=A6VA35_PSEP7|nr:MULTISPECIES: Wzz/FepE/Etk N-terminal domain-containing protein [Pseudomonas aeruginosa group]ABR83491.2 chain length determinant protein [Pseudomonas aeruginosa PA7]KSC92863.1 chain-length determining protein [Pseudomonas aeruginosa]KSD26862.1 chain-length determining protein [Pseudomonas aeruginosa]KSG59577.1 chain-length determining protein [Pseudomonas aeruginosa]MCW8360994.1 Wzz/FepE/Etk N-terminal domain-containing protein [Pseudomonas aeruginosa]